MGVNTTSLLLQGHDPEGQILKQTWQAEGEQSFVETVKGAYRDAALNNPVVNAAVKTADKFFGNNDKLDKNKIKEIYPYAPESFYRDIPNEGVSLMQAALRYSQAVAEDEANRNYRQNETGTIARIGYDILGSSGDPTAIIAGVAGGAIAKGVVGSKPFASLATRYPFMSRAITPLYDEKIAHSMGQILAREFGENVIGEAVSGIAPYAYSKGYANDRYNVYDAGVGIAFGTALSSSVSKLSELIKFRNKTTARIAGESMPSHLQDNVFVETMTREFGDFQASVGAHTPIDALKYGAYNRAKNINTTSHLPRGGSEFYNIVEKTTGLDTSFESKYGSTQVFVNDPLIAEGIAQTAGANFDLNATDFKSAKFVALDTTHSDTSPNIFNYFEKEFGFDPANYTKESGKSLLDLFDDAIKTLSRPDEKKFFEKAQDTFFKAGYQGYIYDGARGLGGTEAKANFSHSVVQLFDTVHEEMLGDIINKVGDLNYENKKMLLEYTGRRSEIYGEGYMSNGKTIKFNEGYFETIQGNPIDGTYEELEAFKGLFSKEQIDDIQAKVNEHDFRSISANYKDLVGKKDLLLQIEDWKQMVGAEDKLIMEEMDKKLAIYNDILNLDHLDNPKTELLFDQLNLTQDIYDQLEELKLVQDVKEQLTLTQKIHEDIQKELVKDIYNQLKTTYHVDEQLQELFKKSELKEQKKLVEQIYKDLQKKQAVYQKAVDRVDEAVKEANKFTPQDNEKAVKSAIVCTRKGE